MTGDAVVYIRCPVKECKRSDGKPTHLVKLAMQHDGGKWKGYEDPVDGVRLYACRTHGRYEVGTDGVPHKPRSRAT